MIFTVLIVATLLSSFNFMLTHDEDEPWFFALMWLHFIITLFVIIFGIIAGMWIDEFMQTYFKKEE
jgi:uncharacterized transporter YbjL